MPRRLLRLLRVALHLAGGLLTVLFLFPWLGTSQREVRIARWSGALLRILNVRATLLGALPDQDARGVLFVANHISWLDIFAIRQRCRVRFVAKAEVHRWPVLGWLAARTGTLFVERARRQETGRAAGVMAGHLRRGDCLCLFPEGTTTDGAELHPFKTALFQAAIDAKTVLWPVTLRYFGPSGAANPAVVYVGETTLLESFWAVAGVSETRVELHFSPPIPAADQDRRHLSSLARHAMTSVLHQVVRRVPETPGDPLAESH